MAFQKGHKINRGRPSPRKGKPLSEKTKLKLSLSRRVRKYPQASLEKHWNWKGGNPKCECGKILSDRRSKRCKKCFHKFAVGENAIGYKHGKATRLPTCLDCGSDLKNFYAKRCQSCSHLREKNHNWNNGSSFHSYDTRFNNRLRRKVRSRDLDICNICGCHKSEYGKNLDVHHIDYDKNNNNESNLISLCNGCHTKTNYDRKKWIEYFSDRVVLHA